MALTSCRVDIAQRTGGTTVLKLFVFQAVVVLSCDNAHMGPDMIVYPGLVMIFAHGIE